MKTYLSAHWRALKTALYRLYHPPLMSLVSLLMIGTTLALPLACGLIIHHLQTLTNTYSPHPQINLFMAQDASATQFKQIEQRLQTHAGVSSYRTIPRAQALEAMKARTGWADIMAGLTQNPLPDAFIISTIDHSAATLDALRTELLAWPKVSTVQVDTEWARRLDSLLRLGRSALGLLAGALSITVLAIVFQSIQLQCMNHRDEIDVQGLLGATNTFIRRPFLYFGYVLGLIGGGIAWGLVSATLIVLNTELVQLSALYDIPLSIPPLPLEWGLGLLCAAAILGGLGAYLSVARHLWNTK
jgi:cell division transport system permease protein